jgi:hypothetical protein
MSSTSLRACGLSRPAGGPPVRRGPGCALPAEGCFVALVGLVGLIGAVGAIGASGAYIPLGPRKDPFPPN